MLLFPHATPFEERAPIYFAPNSWRLQRLLKRCLLLVLFSAVICLALLRFVGMVEAAKVTPFVTIPPVHAAHVTPPSPASPAVAPAVTVPSVPACVPAGVVPAPSPLAITASGLQQRVDPPSTYTVHGTTAAQVATQLHTCAPRSNEGIFSGATSYWLGAHYNFALTADGNCQLTDVAVAIHITQILPNLPASESPTLAAKWNAYAQGLTTHENGHVAIDLQQAQALLDALNSLPAMSCDTITNSANDLTSSHISALASANDAYDSTTNHGATQGAIW